MFFALGFVAMFIIGGLSGVMHASPPADLQQTDTYFVVAHFHYVLFGGSIFAPDGGRLLLVPEDDRPDAERGARQGALLADVHRLQPDVLPDALPRPATACRAGCTPTPAGHGLRASGTPSRPPARSSSASRSWSSSATSCKSLRSGAGRAGRPVERRHAGVVDPVAAAGMELRGGADGGRPGSALGAAARQRRHAAGAGAGERQGHPPAQPVVLADRDRLRDAR